MHSSLRFSLPNRIGSVVYISERKECDLDMRKMNVNKGIDKCQIRFVEWEEFVCGVVDYLV